MTNLRSIAKAFGVDEASMIALSLALAAGVISLPAAAQDTAATLEAVPTQEDATVQDTATNPDIGAEAPISGELGVQADEVATPQLGRLFLTPEQRLLLDDLRNRGPAPAPVARVVAPEVEPEPEPEVEEPEGPVVPELTINGMVIRKGGLSAAWVNGAPIQSGSVTREGIVVRTGRGSVRVVLPSGAQSVRLKPGQKVDMASGSVYEPYDLQKAEVGGAAFGTSSSSAPSSVDDLKAESSGDTDGVVVDESELSLRDILLRLSAPR